MADIIVTAANVVAGSNAEKVTGTAGASITAGEPVYKDPSDGKLKPADNTTEAKAAALGIALHAAEDDQPLTYQKSGDINPGATVAVGEVYCVSGTAGGIAPVADVTTGDYLTILGYGTTANNIRLDINATGIQHA